MIVFRHYLGAPRLPSVLTGWCLRLDFFYSLENQTQKTRDKQNVKEAAALQTRK